MATKKIFLKVFLLITFEATFILFFTDKKSQRSHKTVGIKVLLTIFA
jgi:regulatory protein YycI of two-component signal transduction system YycFG